MIHAEVRHGFSQDADQVWQLTGDFGGLARWLPGVRACRVEGNGAADQGGNAVRIVTLEDGSTAREGLESCDRPNRCYEYSILEARDFDPRSQYRAHFQVHPRPDGGCDVVWRARLQPAPDLAESLHPKIRARIEKTYTHFLHHLAGLLAHP